MATVLDGKGDVTTRTSKLESFLAENPPGTGAVADGAITAAKLASHAATGAALGTDVATVTYVTAQIATVTAGGQPTDSGVAADTRPVLADQSRLKVYSGAGRGFDYWLPENGVVTYPVGTELAIDAGDTAGVLVTPDAGVTVLGPYSDNLWLVNGLVVLKKIGVNTWRMIGQRGPWKILDTASLTQTSLTTASAPDTGVPYVTSAPAVTDWFRHPDTTTFGSITCTLRSNQSSNGLFDFGGTSASTFYRGTLAPVGLTNLRAKAKVSWTSTPISQNLFLNLNSTSPAAYYKANYNPTGTVYAIYKKLTSGSEAIVGTTSVAAGALIPVANTGYQWQLDIIGGIVTFTVDGTVVASYDDSAAPLPPGAVGIRASSGSVSRYDDVSLEYVVTA